MPPSRLSDRVQVCRPERSAGERAQFRGNGRDGPPFRGTPIPRKGPARGSRFGVQEPPASNSSPSCILRSPSLGVGRGEVGSRGSTACRLQSAPRGLPVAPGRPLSPGPAIWAREAGEVAARASGNGGAPGPCPPDGADRRAAPRDGAGRSGPGAARGCRRSRSSHVRAPALPQPGRDVIR